MAAGSLRRQFVSGLQPMKTLRRPCQAERTAGKTEAAGNTEAAVHQVCSRPATRGLADRCYWRGRLASLVMPFGLKCKGNRKRESEYSACHAAAYFQSNWKTPGKRASLVRRGTGDAMQILARVAARFGRLASCTFAENCSVTEILRMLFCCATLAYWSHQHLQ